MTEETDRSSRQTSARSFLTELVGEECHPRRIARDPVSISAIRSWCDAMGSEFSESKQMVPPAMLPIWSMPGMEPGRPVTAGPSREGDLTETVRLRMAEWGFSGTLATKSEQRYLSPVALGDLISAESRYISASDRKHTSLGIGYFLTYETVFKTQREVIVGTQRTTVIHFKPREDSAQLPPPAPARSMARDRPADAGEIRLGGRFTHRIPLSPTLIIAGAIASRDFYPVHHDREYARAHGSPDIVMSIPTTCGLLARVTDEWTSARPLTALSVRLRASAHPYYDLDLQGEVVDLGAHTAQIAITARTTASIHAEALAVVSLV